MKTLFTIISVFCTVNLLVLLGGVGWLVSGGRLDQRRINDVVALFQETTADRDQREIEAERVAQQELEDQAEQERLASPPLTAEQWTERKLEGDEVLNERTRRLRREADDLKRAISAERASFDEDVAAFEAERDAWESMRKRVLEAEESAQFQTALETLRKVPAESAASMLTEIDRTSGREIVVSYLNAMDIRSRTAIFTEFEGQDAAMAADLLERLRTLGIEARADAGNQP